MIDFFQGSLNIVAYYTKIKGLWDELDTLNTKAICSCTCDCGGKEKMVKAQQDERLIQFLMGLSEAYAAVRSNILMISPLPSVNLAYSLLIQDEKQRERYVFSYLYEIILLIWWLMKVDHRSILDMGTRCKHLNTSLRRFTKTKRDPNTIRSNVVVPSELPCFPSSLPNFVGNTGSQLTQEHVSQLIHLLNQAKVTQPDADLANQSAIAAYVGLFIEEASGSW
ncbi:hypothetical protein KY289_035744 [Solanum tuberosum]|nr:hypothetical protein KY289_035744 [Solanum tuberosum]